MVSKYQDICLQQDGKSPATGGILKKKQNWRLNSMVKLHCQLKTLNLNPKSNVIEHSIINNNLRKNL